MIVMVVLGQQGRLVIPADVRAALGQQPAEALHLHGEDQRLVLERPRSEVSQLRGLVRSVPGGSPFEELLAERRADAAAS